MKIRSLLTIFLIVLLVLTACGRRDEEAEPAAESPAAQAEQGQAEEPAEEAPTPTDTPEPSPTPEPTPTESVLPTPTPTVVSPLPTPTAPEPLSADPCEEELTGQDAQLAEQYPALGCPEAAAELVDMARQPFENGQMIWRSDNSTIYVLYSNGSWESFEDTFEEGDPESDPALVPPEGTLQPIRGFGRVWREELGGPAAAIGWGMAKEQGVSGSVQPWEHGLLIGFGLPERFLLFENGAWQRVE